MVLPFVTILAKIFFCSLADRHRAYRAFFICFLTSALLGYGSFGVLPFFITPQPKEQGLNRTTWAIICLMNSVATISMAVISCLSDAFAMNSSKKNNSSYGLIRLWGTLGWGASSVVISLINQTDKLPYLVPGLIMTIILIGIDIVAAIFWPNAEDFKLDKSASDMDVEDVVSVLTKETSLNPIQVKLSDENDADQRTSNSYGTYDRTKTTIVASQSNSAIEEQSQVRNASDVKVQWLLFKEVAKKRRSLFRYMILFTISGALIALQWSYFFLYLEYIYKADFTFISGFSMVVQSMLGELPFFILSKVIIQQLGKSHTLSLSITSIGIRYLLYRYLLPNASMYFVLLTETFQGPNFGLFYVVMTEVGLDYSDCEEAIVKVVEEGVVANNPKEIEKLRQSLRATMQSVVSACYEGLGLGIGSILGGLITEYYGYDYLWIWGALTAIVLGLANYMIEVLGLPIFVDKEPRLIRASNIN